MNNFKPVLLAVAAAALIAPNFASAGEGVTTSYSMKKQGRVHFQEKTAETPAMSMDMENVNPADIEPAAGGYEMDAPQEDALKESMKLPRK